MLGHIDCFARTEIALLTLIGSQYMSTTLLVVLRSKTTSIRVALDAWDFGPCRGIHEWCQGLVCPEKGLEAIYSRMCSAGDSLESAGQTNIDAGVSRTIGFQAGEDARLFRPRIWTYCRHLGVFISTSMPWKLLDRRLATSQEAGFS